MRLFRIGSTWYADITTGAERIRRSTRCTDKKAAEAVARQWERDAADPAHTTTSQATLNDALSLLIADREEQAAAGRKSASTVSFYKSKAGHWLRVLEGEDDRRQPFPIATLEARDIDAYISTRREEGVGENTIQKELITLRSALKLAKRSGIWKGDVASIFPVAFSPEYKPRERALSYDEARDLIAELTPDRAARVAFILATSANWNETERARLEDINEGHTRVLIRGTKRASRHRVVPIVSQDQHTLLEFAIKHAGGPGEPLFEPWQNVRRDLDAACLRIERRLNPGFDHGPDVGSKKLRSVPPLPFKSVSPNDLRRTFATWLRALGAPPHLIALMMGHTDSRMVERVYGRIPVDEQARLLASELGEFSLPYFSLNPVQSMDEKDEMDSEAGKAPEARIEKTPQKRGFFVPRDGIEPPTRGFSILCSTN